MEFLKKVGKGLLKIIAVIAVVALVNAIFRAPVISVKTIWSEAAEGKFVNNGIIYDSREDFIAKEYGLSMDEYAQEIEQIEYMESHGLEEDTDAYEEALALANEKAYGTRDLTSISNMEDDVEYNTIEILDILDNPTGENTETVEYTIAAGDNFAFSSNSVKNNNASVEEYPLDQVKQIKDLAKNDIIAAYKVSGYGQDSISIDISDTLSNNKIGKKDDVWIECIDETALLFGYVDEDECKIYTYTPEQQSNGNVITIQCPNDVGSDFILLIKTGNVAYASNDYSDVGNENTKLPASNVVGKFSVLDYIKNKDDKTQLASIAVENALNSDSSISIFDKKKDVYADNILADIKDELNLSEDETEDLKEFKAIVTCVSLTVLLNNYPEIKYVSTGNKEVDEYYLEAFLNDLRKSVETGVLFSPFGHDYTLDDCYEISKPHYYVTKFLCDLWPENRQLFSKDIRYVFQYCTEQEIFEAYALNSITDYSGIKEDFRDIKNDLFLKKNIKEHLENPSEKFDPYIDEFCFGNFCSYLNPDGNCAGIALYTAKLFNDKQFTDKGEYTFKSLKNAYSWNLSKDKENDVLLNRGISTYQDYQWSNKFHSLISRNNSLDINTKNTIQNVSSAELEFINMISCLCQEFNDVDPSINTVCPSSSHGDDRAVKSKTGANVVYPASLVDEMKSYIDKNEVLVCGINAKSYTGDISNPIEQKMAHAFTVYDYFEGNDYLDRGNLQVFCVYDSNYPQNRYEASPNYLIFVPNDDGNYWIAYTSDKYSVKGNNFSLMYNNRMQKFQFTAMTSDLKLLDNCYCVDQEYVEEFAIDIYNTNEDMYSNTNIVDHITEVYDMKPIYADEIHSNDDGGQGFWLHTDGSTYALRSKGGTFYIYFDCRCGKFYTIPLDKDNKELYGSCKNEECSTYVHAYPIYDEVSYK